ncbi:putative phage holin [Streptomyces zhihengii]
MELDGSQMTNVVASGLVSACSLVFVLVYGLTAPWWKSAIGRHMMAFSAAIGLLCLYTVLITVWSEGLPATLLRSARVALLIAIGVLLLQRTSLAYKAQHQPSRDPGGSPPPRTGV